MIQLTPKPKSAEMRVQELPLPTTSRETLLVRNYYSLINAGTAGSTVRTARKVLTGKAKERPKQVLEKQRQVHTYHAVMKKTEAYSALGHSSSGQVIEAEEGVTGFAVSDMEACVGAGYANSGTRREIEELGYRGF